MVAPFARPISLPVACDAGNGDIGRACVGDIRRACVASVPVYLNTGGA